jgi:hypothetical protein
MGEAWFMGKERKLFDNLAENDSSNICWHDVVEALGEIAYGVGGFGPRDEWRQWFHYLLGLSIAQVCEAHDDDLLQSLITAFFTQYPAGLDIGPYPGFREDVLLTLGQCVTSLGFWEEVSSKLDDPFDYFGVDELLESVSASLFFCVKYLKPNELEAWTRSLFELDFPLWKALLLEWLVGAHKLLNGDIHQPYELSSAESQNLEWSWSSSLNGNYTGDFSEAIKPIPFLPETNRNRFMRCVRNELTEEVYWKWRYSIEKVPYLEVWLTTSANKAYDLYVDA